MDIRGVKLQLDGAGTRYKGLFKVYVILLDWIPGTGIITPFLGKVHGEPFQEPALFKAMMSIWLGLSPGDWRLKDALLDVKEW